MEKSWISDNIVDQYWQEPLRINQLDMLQSRNCSVADAWYSTVQSYHLTCMHSDCFPKDLCFVLFKPLFDWCSCAPPTLLGAPGHMVTCSIKLYCFFCKMAYFRLAKSHNCVVNLMIWWLISFSLKLTTDFSCFQESHTPKNWSICRFINIQVRY